MAAMVYLINLSLERLIRNITLFSEFFFTCHMNGIDLKRTLKWFEDLEILKMTLYLKVVVR